jgi:uncharacterized protein (DUF488 family)
MKSKLTQNRNSLQCVLPKDLTEKYGFRRGDEIWFEERPDEVAIRTPRMMANSIVFTIGYEGETIESFVDALKGAGIEQLIDVRELALSRKNGFSKAALGTRLEREGIRYRHMPELGSPTDMRKEYKNGGGHDKFMTSYSEYLASKEGAMDDLAAFVMARRSALMCFEKDATQCHRMIIAGKLQEEGFCLKHL